MQGGSRVSTVNIGTLRGVLEGVVRWPKGRDLQGFYACHPTRDYDRGKKGAGQIRFSTNYSSTFITSSNTSISNTVARSAFCIKLLLGTSAAFRSALIIL